MNDCPVFILGLHRSGTTLLYEMLSSSQCWNSIWAWHVICYDTLRTGSVDTLTSQRSLQESFEDLGITDREVDSVSVNFQTKEEYGFILDNGGHGLHLRPDNFEYFHRLCETIQSTYEQRRPLLLKNPWDFGTADLIHQRLPNAKFVCIYREPVKVISSQWRFFRRMIIQGMPYVAMLSRRYARLRKQPLRLLGMRTLFTWCPRAIIRQLTNRAAAETTKHRKAISQVPEMQRIALTFDDLCQKPQATMQRLIEFLGCSCESDWGAMISSPAGTIDPQVDAQQGYIRQKFADLPRTIG